MAIISCAWYCSPKSHLLCVYILFLPELSLLVKYSRFSQICLTTCNLLWAVTYEKMQQMPHQGKNIKWIFTAYLAPRPVSYHRNSVSWTMLLSAWILEWEILALGANDAEVCRVRQTSRLADTATRNACYVSPEMWRLSVTTAKAV